MKFFDDPELKKSIQSVNFGKVKVGTSEEKIIYILNDSDAILTNLVYEFPSLPATEVLKIEGPVTIQPKKVGKLLLTWKPSANFKKALKVDIDITGDEIYGDTMDILTEKVVE